MSKVITITEKVHKKLCRLLEKNDTGLTNTDVKTIAEFKDRAFRLLEEIYQEWSYITNKI
ncbi:hypothetical protein LCGC14_1027080 [marine sediment metagenome]|uniref:Uncharacterized protein n=1 Tax=marine sediment metagenome TaxID=412755 RepID=A0A0F9R1M6_9ZZZZ